MIYSFAECVDAIIKIEKEHPEINFENFEKVKECLTLVTKLSEESFNFMLRKDARMYFDTLVVTAGLESLSEELRNAFFKEIYAEYFGSPNFHEWHNNLVEYIGSEFELLRDEYFCESLHPGWKEKWIDYVSYFTALKRMSEDESYLLNNAVLNCLPIYLEHGKSDELDTALEELKDFERSGKITLEEYQLVIDYWFQ